MADWRSAAFVYVFRRTDGIRKLGWTIDIRRRRCDCTAASGVEHEVEAWWETDERTAIFVEGAVHASLKQHRLRGHSSIELYRLPLRRLADAVTASFAAQGMEPRQAQIGKPTLEQLQQAYADGGLMEAAKKTYMKMATLKEVLANARLEQLEEVEHLGVREAARVLSLTPSGYSKALERERYRAAAQKENQK